MQTRDACYLYLESCVCQAYAKIQIAINDDHRMLRLRF